MRGGSLTRYHPPSTSVGGQGGGAFTQDLIKMATPLVASRMREGLASLEKGQSWCEAGKAMLTAAKQGIKWKALMEKEGLYKKATKQARDIFGV